MASGLCTRYATQVVFRRSPLEEASTTVSIIPAADAEDSYKNKLMGYNRVFTELSTETFAEVLDEVRP